MLFRKKKDSIARVDYDPAVQEPVLKASICTGETVAGFRKRGSDHVDEVMLIRGEDDLARFMEIYQLTEKPKTIY